MPYTLFDLQLFGEEGATAGADTGSSGLATTGAENPTTEGVATGGVGEQAAPAGDSQTAPEETFESLIKGKYKDDYDKAVKKAINSRFKHNRDLQSQIDQIDPVVRQIAQRYGIAANPDGSIPIQSILTALDNDNSMYEKEAFERGISVDELKRTKQLEREVQTLKAQNERSARDREWEAVVSQAEITKQTYPGFDLDTELQNPQFGKLLATMQRSGFPNAVQTAYEAIHRDEIMGGAMRYAVEQTRNKISNSIQSGMSRPAENGVGQAAAASVGNVDPSKLTKAQIDDIKRRAEMGERIAF